MTCACGCGGIVSSSARRLRGHHSKRPTNWRAWPLNRIRWLPDGCVQWTGAISPVGYGTRRVNKVYVSAHRYAYQEAYGPVPEGWDVHHTCHNRACVNPTHMEIRERQEHGSDGKLTWNQVRAIRAMHAEGDKLHREIAAVFEISRVAATNIINRKTWRADPAAA